MLLEQKMLSNILINSQKFTNKTKYTCLVFFGSWPETRKSFLLFFIWTEILGNCPFKLCIQLMWTEICHNNGNFKFKISSVENMCTVTVLLLGSLSKLCALSQSCSLVHCQNYVHWPSLAPSLHCRKYVHCHSLAPLFTVENMCTVTVLLLRTLSKISALSQSCSFVHY